MCGDANILGRPWYHLKWRDLSAERVSLAFFVSGVTGGGKTTMADSNITKQALAASLRELMEEVPFEKINVSQICERCGMNRKSFYYHFKDKYDLVNWIFDTEFISLVSASMSSDSYQEQWDFIEKSCRYFYENRSFYRKALQIKGQNSFSDHYMEYFAPILRSRLSHLLGDEHLDEFSIDFFSDAMLCAMKRWLLAKNCMPPEQFVSQAKRLVQLGAAAICQEIDRETDEA